MASTDLFPSFDAIAAAAAAWPSPDPAARAAAAARNAVLTKPAGALGRLEEIALWWASWRGAPITAAPRAQAIVFAGNHGVAARGVSPYPPAVTAQMVANFDAGGAAVNQLCALNAVPLTVHALDLDSPTADFTEAPALSLDECLGALATGWAAVDPEADALILGEMGIGNTTAAAALTFALHGGVAEDWTGRGAGADDAMLTRKTDIVRAGAVRHRAEIDAVSPALRGLEALRRLGGREFAAIVGAALRARAERQVLIVDGFIVTAALSALAGLREDAFANCVAAHCSAEAGHARLMAALGLSPLLDLGLRLGEGSGAALAFGLVRSALACHTGMATFESAGVSDKA